ncbi:hypothetical protein [Marinobacter sp. ANT_B65]|uniref:hypothetical protein n=1 Tax=Marinobacter sp. ANT_B65 TaxID=2039467 RepID=UPI000BBF1FFC|nr:hypothetical protein [Marinobacter sp. ANT_B65]PCM45888.1 hypothetical protein CPA50_08000 [Marinobacter sp. ANT_B65]
MRNIALITIASLAAVVALPAQASLADRKSDVVIEAPAHPAPYSGQVVIRGEIQSDEGTYKSAQPAPYSGQVVIRGQVQPASHG